MFDIISELLRTKNQKRKIKILQEQHDKNIRFFRKRSPEVADFLANAGTKHFQLAVNDEFLDILDMRTGQCCHPKGKLLQTIRELGSWHHDRWIDKLEVTHRVLWGSEHGEITHSFITKMHKQVPSVARSFEKGVLGLPRFRDGKRFSGAVAFVGLFSGLHIIHYLLNTRVRDLILIEPNLDNFALSSWFLDYEAIEKNWRLILHVGVELPEDQLSRLIDESPITSTAWLRILSAYSTPEYEDVIQRLNLRWRALNEIIVPFDRERRNLLYGMRNLKAKLPINHLSPSLSDNSRIAVVASGPSLVNDLAWLKRHQDRLIILAAHSTIKVLKQHQIRPDFLCSLDTEIDDELMAKLDFDYDIPFISYYKADPKILARFKKVLLVNEGNKANSVYFYNALTGTHPTTGNLATSVAVFSKPTQLYFVGLDLAFRSTTQEHVAGYWLGKDDVVAESTQPELAQANFLENQGSIYTQSYYDAARMTMECVLVTLEGKTQIYNLSDGAKIVGAQPRHSENIELSPYPEKQQDLLLFEAAFLCESEGIWVSYPRTGREIIEVMLVTFNKVMKLDNIKQFDWVDFSKKLDRVWRFIMHDVLIKDQEKIDIRIEVFGKLIHDLLTEWYRVMLLVQGTQELQSAYYAGLKEISDILDSLQWETELDSFILDKPLLTADNIE
ncbi:MAG: hypothetical protein RL368_308 [Pseudomonadota bacterium]|jgi:hypothetical protein